jgi:ATP-dependent exoDNAse (exonuclease V) beta subunit
MSERFTAEQQRAIRSLAGDLVVAAGAGSGKTTVLAHRFAEAVTARPERPASALDRVLMITFTNKAAAEVGDRVRRVLRARSDDHSAECIEGAWISTIHSFCARIVRRHTLECGIPPNFAQADETLSATLRDAAFDAAVFGIVEDAGTEELFEALPLAELRARVVACHDNARALGLDPSETVLPLGTEQLSVLKELAVGAAQELERVLAEGRQTPAVALSAERLSEWTAALWACGLEHSSGCEEVLSACEDYDIKGLRGAANDANRVLRERIEELRVAAQAVLHKPALEALQKLTREFARRYRQLKRDRRVLDFDDLQEAVVRAFDEHPAMAARYRAQFDLLMIDEFQDTNDLQMRVLAPLRSENLCVVGDERQSIYGFRYADVEVFRRVTSSIPASIELKDNFRSHADIIDFVNATFSQPHLFGNGFMQLHAGRVEDDERFAALPGPRIEVLLANEDDVTRATARAAEAAAIAERVKGLVTQGVRAGEIAVLLRVASSATLFADAIERLGVPVVVGAGAGLYDTPETAEVMALLRAAAVPADDEALLRVLCGRLVALPDDALLAVRQHAGSGALWDGLCALGSEDRAGEAELTQDAEDAIRHAYAALSRLGALQGRVPLGQFVREACEAFDYDVTLHALGRPGQRAWANVLKLVRHAASFEAAEGNDVARLVEHLAHRSRVAGDRPAPAEAEVDAVQVMTVHAAKGLEFPVVFAADLVAPQDFGSPSMLVEPARIGGALVPAVGVRLPDRSCGGARTPLYTEMAQRRVRRDVEEEKRCLYVACTRARERLILAGCTRAGKPAEQGRGLIDWVREGVGDAVAGEVTVGGAPVIVSLVEPSSTIVSAPRAEADPRGPLVAVPQEAERPIAPPPFPTSVSYSALHLGTQCPLSFFATYVLRLSPFSAPGDRPDALEFGSAVHEALQARVRSTLDARRLEAITRQHHLDPSEAERLTRAVEGFYETPVAAALSTATSVAVEQPVLVDLGGTLLVGSIDLLGWQGERAIVVDYKTGTAPDGSPEREAGYALQARCYALAALRAGAGRVDVTFAFVEQGASVSREFGFVASDADDILDQLRGIVESLKSDPKRHLDSYSPALCGRCPGFETVCPVSAPRAV